MIYHAGDIFKLSMRIGNRTIRIFEVMLVQVETYKYCLVVLEGGNRYKDPVYLSHKNITRKELLKLVNNKDVIRKIAKNRR